MIFLKFEGSGVKLKLLVDLSGFLLAVSSCFSSAFLTSTSPFPYRLPNWPVIVSYIPSGVELDCFFPFCDLFIQPSYALAFDNFPRISRARVSNASMVTRAQCPHVTISALSLLQTFANVKCYDN